MPELGGRARVGFGGDGESVGTAVGAGDGFAEVNPVGTGDDDDDDDDDVVVVDGRVTVMNTDCWPLNRELSPANTLESNVDEEEATRVVASCRVSFNLAAGRLGFLQIARLSL